MDTFDLVDSDDHIIGVTDKVQAHANGQLHRVAAVFVFDDAGKLYVQSHKKSGNYDHSVGGHIKQGESYEDAAKREAFEELGIKQPFTHVTNFISDEDPRVHHLVGLYECVAAPAWQFLPNDEVEEITPMTLEDLTSLMTNHPEKFSTDFKLAVSHYLQIRR